MEDQVIRKERMLAAHPEWGIVSPFSLRSILRGESSWRALGPAGQFFRERELCDLLDRIEADLTE